MIKRLLSLMLALMMLLSVVPAQVFAMEGDPLNQVENELEQYDEAGSGFPESEEFTDDLYVGEQEALPIVLSETEPIEEFVEQGEYVIDSYDLFLTYLPLLEQLAVLYVQENPGPDPLALVIKYIRTGVDRYNSGSWGIMAGYEDANFAEYVKVMEDGINAEVEAAGGTEADMYRITSLKNLENFVLPNGDTVDFGHMFGTMDITYHNNFDVDHADVAGWAGDLVDLLSTTDRHGVTGTLEEMVADISANYLNKVYPGESDQFGLTDMYGDLDGFYLMERLSDMEYEMDNEMGTLATLISEYFTGDLTDEDRAAFLLKNRLGDVSTRSAIRDAVYIAYTGNKMISTLEGTREFASEDLETLRKACCYAFADYLCKLAGDYVENIENPHYTVFSSETAVLAPGITQDIKHATNANGDQIVYYIATADITRGDVHVFANYNENDPSKGWKMSRVEDQANAAQAKYGDPESEYYIPNYNVIASTNGAGYDMSTGEPGGLLVMGGVEYHPINSNGFFGILKNGKAVIGTTEEYNTIYKDQVQEGIAGFGARLIKNGKICVSGSDLLAPRTAVGITATGKVVLMVLDGRGAPWSVGAGMPEIAQIMYEAGCVEAVNLDGGGSSTYVARQPGEDALSVVNKPSDGEARSVSASLMVVSTAPSSTAFDHALIESDYRYLTQGASIQLTAKGVSATGNTAELPEGTYWTVSDTNYASITEDGVLTALRSNGTVEVNLMLGEDVIGSMSVDLVTPNNVYFTRDNLNAVYGQSVALPVKALYNGKDVAFLPEDLVFTLSRDVAGTMNGFVFTAAEGSGIKNVTVTVALKDGSRSDTINIALYDQGEMTFDFDRATGGDRQMAWDRQVSNAITEDTVTYEVVDPDKDMVTSYTFAIDMTQIPIPEELEELVYMLPGADMEGASAWTFLLQLAERVSVLTEVKPVITFDPNMDVDYSDLKIINEYFELTNTEFDEATNTLTLTLNWIDQTAAIDPAVANPMCIVSGIKLTPKADVDWGAKGTLEIVNSGDISYKAYLRASALYSFAQKPENQAEFNLYPFVNPNDETEKGGWFGDTYKEFRDTYKLINELKEGWYNEDGGFVYYVAGQRHTGIQEVDGLYYDFGESGINIGKTPYSGMFEKDGKVFYAKLGELFSGWQSINEAWYLFDWKTCEGTDGTYNTTIDGVKVTYEFEDGRLLKGYWHEDSLGLRYFYGPYYYKQGWKEIDGETYYFEEYYAYTGICPVRPGHTQFDTWYEFTDTGVLVGKIEDGLYWYKGDLYYVVDALSDHYGFYLIDGNYYYFQSDNTAIVNRTNWASKTNDLLPSGTYRFGEDGRVLMDEAIVNEEGVLYYYKNGKRTAHGGLVKFDGAYYFIDGYAKAITNAKQWISDRNNNGLLPQGSYEFGPDGKLIIYQGVVNGYYYVDGVRTAAGLVEQDGYYYFATSGGKIVTDQRYWVSQHNGLVSTGTYRFDAEGKMIRTTEIVEEDGALYYYKDGKRTVHGGLVKFGDDYYFIDGWAKAITNAKQWISNSNSNGLWTQGTYEFGPDGKMIIYRGVVDGYYYVDGVKTAAGLVEQDGDYYFAGSGGKIVTDQRYWVSQHNGLVSAGTYRFDAEGKMIRTTEIVEEDGALYYYKDGKRTVHGGLVKFGDDYYFIDGWAKAITNAKQWISNSNSNGLWTQGTYEFGPDGKMIIYRGVVDGYYYVDGVKTAAGLVEQDGDYYFAGSGGKIVTDQRYWVSQHNGLVSTGTYRFDAEGKMIRTTEIVEEDGALYYYKDGKRTVHGGLVKFGDDYYFIDGWAKAITNAKQWISNSNSNGLWTQGTYEFGPDGKMIINQGVVDGYYYVDGVKTAAGLVEQDGYYYFATSGGKLVVSQSYWVSQHNGLVSTGTYRFDAEGRMIRTTEIVNENGTLYYYKDGKRTVHAGLVKFGDDYYFIDGRATAITNAKQWISNSNSNGLVKEGVYSFGADGKMITA